MKNIKNKDGVLSVEALISVSVFLIVVVILIDMIMLVYAEEKMQQYTYDLISEIEIYNYIYEKIGLDEIVDINSYEININKYLEDIPGISKEYNKIFNIDKLLVDESKKQILSSIFKLNINNELDKYSWNSSIKTYEFQIVESNLKITYSYEVDIFNNKFQMKHYFEKELWLFGDNSNMYPNKSLISILNSQFEKEKNTIVYKTRTGSKYHRKDCFYIVRSTTDKNNISELNLFRAKTIYLLSGCSRCIREGK